MWAVVYWHFQTSQDMAGKPCREDIKNALANCESTPDEHMANAEDVSALEAAKKGQAETGGHSAKKPKTDDQVDKSPMEEDADDEDEQKADSVTLSGSERKSSNSGSSSTSSSQRKSKKKKAKNSKKGKQKAEPKAKAKTRPKATAEGKAKAKTSSGPKCSWIVRKQGLIVCRDSSCYFSIQWFQYGIYPGIPT